MCVTVKEKEPVNFKESKRRGVLEGLEGEKKK